MPRKTCIFACTDKQGCRLPTHGRNSEWPGALDRRRVLRPDAGRLRAVRVPRGAGPRVRGQGGCGFLGERVLGFAAKVGARVGRCVGVVLLTYTPNLCSAPAARMPCPRCTMQPRDTPIGWGASPKRSLKIVSQWEILGWSYVGSVGDRRATYINSVLAPASPKFVARVLPRAMEISICLSAYRSVESSSENSPPLSFPLTPPCQIPCYCSPCHCRPS